MGTEAIKQFLAYIGIKEPHLQPKDPTNLLSEQSSNWLLTLPSLVFYGIVDNIENLFGSHPQSLCL
jgi:hypothetical protein